MDPLAALDDLEGEMMSIVGEDAIDPESREEESFYETSTSEANLYSAEDGSSNTATVSSGEESDLGANLDRNVIGCVAR
ncbi:hypothetical protein JCM33374_g2494 [Metschnikowia sp. JCM 33374]|nr:hypothetical protein JCM33374_g2494 [Metschnikowia sp. JCM 33374]